MEIYKILCLAVIQGITEFLPVSSSGHLAIASKLLGLSEGTVLVAVVLHAGSLVSILMVYFKEILKLFSKKKSRIIILIIVATIPVSVVGLFLNHLDITKNLFDNLIFPGFGLILSGIIIKMGMTGKKKGKKLKKMTYNDALIIGLFQCIAILPGVSRSGSTISAGLIRKIRRKDAATFSFLIAIPAIAGASVVKIGSYLSRAVSHGTEPEVVTPFALILGFIVTAIVGYGALKLLISQVRKGKFAGYAYYCFFLGTIIVIWQFLTMGS